MALLGSFSFQFLPDFAAVFAEEGGVSSVFAIVRTDKSIKWDFSLVRLGRHSNVQIRTPGD